MLMCGQSNQVWHYYAGRYPGKVGMLLGPSYFAKQAIRKWMPYALDNDAFTAWRNKTQWDKQAWEAMLQRAKLTGIAPLWVLVPDVVADRQATLESWERYAPIASKYGWPLAFAVQDGMTLSDVPHDAQVVFVGGTTEWKWRTLPMWAESGRRVHVGRVNELHRLWTCERLGVESVDGSGWFRGTDQGRQGRLIELWINGEGEERTMEMAL